MRALPAVIMATLRGHWRALLIFHLLFGLIATTALLPLTTAMVGLVVTSSDRNTLDMAGLIELLAAPLGWLSSLVALVGLILLGLLQQAGMLATVVAGHRHGHYRAGLAGFWHAVRSAHRLAPLALVLAAAVLLLTLPLTALGAAAYDALLGHYDNYYVRLARPPELRAFLALAAGLAAVCVAGLAWLYLRWLLALPHIVLGGERVGAALAQSVVWMHGRRRATLAAVLVTGAIALLLPPLLAVGLERAGGAVLALVPPRLALVVPVMLAYMTLVAALAVLAAFAAGAVHAALLLGLYARATGRGDTIPADPSPATGHVLWSAEALLVVVTLGQAFFLLPAIEVTDDVRVTAHRGSPEKAPENTLPALEQAIIDGADAVEFDVRQTRDGALVLWHDRDLRRLGGDARAVAEVTLAQMRRLDVGAAFGPEFAGTGVATLAEAIEVLRGRAAIHVDIKHSPRTPEITRKVIEELQAHGVTEDSAILSNRPAVLAEVGERAPGLERVQLAEFIIGDLDRSVFDALALRQNRVNAAAVARARRHGHALHVWTVNDPAAMERFIDLGVDHIITDRPQVLSERLARRAEMSAGERLLLRLHDWHRR